MSNVNIRAMRTDEWAIVARLIHDSTNQWYTSRRLPPIFGHGPASTMLFCEVYEALDPGCCLVAEDPESRELVGSCFYHPRSTHYSLGIMNVAVDQFGKGIATQLLRGVLERADERGLPTRLVSSALNLDSYSLYNRQAFTPYAVYQDMVLTVPAAGMSAVAPPPPRSEQVRTAAPLDAQAMAALERQHVGIERQKDFEFFIRNQQGIWQALVIEDATGSVAGFMCAVRHPASNMVGPGFAKSEEAAIALLYQGLEHHAGNQPVVLVPASSPRIAQALYSWGAKNCELHVAQVRGDCPEITGIAVPSFMPETA